MSPAQTDLTQRLAWLYGDVAERIAHNQPDLQKWRHIGGQVFAQPWSRSGQFARAVLSIAKAALT